MPQLQNITINIHKLLRTDSYGGVTYLVAPVVMLRQGVFNNILYTNEELRKFPEAWNGRDVPVRHPEVNGEKVSVADPKIIEESVVGKVFNTEFVMEGDEGVLKAELWINEERGKELIPTVIEDLHKGLPVEVSTGLFTDTEMKSGTITNARGQAQMYGMIAHNYRPDHLAILPDQTGACSVSAGCGLNVNEDKRTGKEAEKEKKKGVIKALAEFLGLSGDDVDVNEISHSDIRTQLRNLVPSGPDEFVWVMDVFGDHFIFERETGMVTKLFKQDYKIENDIVSSVGVPVEVIERSEFVEVAMVANDKQKQTPADKQDEIKSDNKGVTIMNEEQRNELIGGIIANDANGFAEEDRAILEGMGEDALTKMAVVKKTPETDTTKKDPATNAEDCGCDGKETPAETPAVTPATNAQTPFTLEDVAKVVKEGIDKALVINSKLPIVNAILANEKNVLTEETLNTMDEAGLKKYADSIAVNFFGVPTGDLSATNADEEGPEDMPILQFNAAAGE